MDMTGKVINKYIFDHDFHFVGFSLYDVKEKTDENWIGIGANLTTLEVSEVDQLFLESYDTTRLIGFRTSKECKQSDFISEIQPIYYSTD